MIIITFNINFIKINIIVFDHVIRFLMRKFFVLRKLFHMMMLNLLILFTFTIPIIDFNIIIIILNNLPLYLLTDMMIIITLNIDFIIINIIVFVHVIRFPMKQFFILMSLFHKMTLSLLILFTFKVLFIDFSIVITISNNLP